MKRLFLLLSVLAFLQGCAITPTNFPVAGPDDVVFVIKDIRSERLRGGNVLFVNRSPIWREVLVFDGRLSEDQMIGFGSDGLPTLMAKKIGRFDIGPAEDGARDEDSDYNRKLVRFLWPGQEYTLLVISKTVFGNVAAPFQVMHGRVSTHPMEERYYYRAWIGPNAGQTIFDIVNDVEYLPDVYIYAHRGTNYLFNKSINVNELIQRGIHRSR